MAFSDDLSATQAVIYGALGAPAEWTPQGQSAVTVTLLRDQADANAEFSSLGRRVVARNVFRLRVSEIAALVAAGALTVGTMPAKGDQILFAETELTIINQPDRRDAWRTEWTLECS